MGPEAGGLIRLAHPAEADALYALAASAYAPWVAVIGRRPLPMDDDYAARIRAGQAWVLDEGGSVVALAALEPGDGWVTLDNVAVHPERQGEGLGRRMIAFAAAEARRRGARELRLFTNALMAANLARYARLGFRETGHERVGPYDRVNMTLDLAR